MALMTCNVLCVVHDEAGLPVEGARIGATLNRPEVYAGYVVPRLVEGVTDARGEAVLALWPNQLGATASLYVVRIALPSGQQLCVQATVPDVSSIYLHQIAELPPYPGMTSGQLILDDAVAAVAPAIAARLGAEAARDVTLLARDQAAASREDAQAAMLAAQGARDAAELARAAAVSAQDEAGRQAAAAGMAAGQAADDADAADQARILAQAAQASARDWSGLAGTHAAAAGASAGEAAAYVAQIDALVTSPLTQLATSLIQTQALMASFHAFE